MEKKAEILEALEKSLLSNFEVNKTIHLIIGIQWHEEVKNDKIPDGCYCNCGRFFFYKREGDKIFKESLARHIKRNNFDFFSWKEFGELFLPWCKKQEWWKRFIHSIGGPTIGTGIVTATKEGYIAVEYVDPPKFCRQFLLFWRDKDRGGL